MRALRNMVIIVLLALLLEVVPGGGNVADGILAVLMLGFLFIIAGIGFLAYRQNRFAYMTLDQTHRVWLLGALGAIVFMIAGADELLGTGPGTLVFLGVIGLSIFAIVRVVAETRSL